MRSVAIAGGCAVIGLLISILAWSGGVAAAAPDVPGAPDLGRSANPAPAQPPRGVCPPFPLRDETGEVIDPVRGVNATVPYSPKQTCGREGCHDYALITEGYHFTQGKGEAAPFPERYPWTSSPGNYGGTWCSPAPLYRQLAPKQNASAREIDMTSFDFVLGSCGGCHPGGGPLEYDRDGYRYDERMRDPEAGLTPAGDNAFDGDYYKARWSESGVLEADCLLCHLPSYDLQVRNAAVADMNFRWAATAGASLGEIHGKVISGESPEVVYDLRKFDAAGNVLLHIVPEPRNETCLRCHMKPGWKKRGAGFTSRTDVHLAAGLRCVDCHAAGSRAEDPRIRKREAHQFGKGDDPSGWVRNDLDDTVLSCERCHLERWGNAPLARHGWLPPLHMKTISCQACHIPTRSVKSALVQASDVYNPAPRITPPSKHIWTFYDQEMNFWNHYGELDLFTGADKPSNPFRPTLARYKGKIYPVNRVHSTWVGFEEDGRDGIHMLFMRDYYRMWSEHRADPDGAYPLLAVIQDDNGDGAPEVNRPGEIDALLASVGAYLEATRFPMEGRRLVWVRGDRAWYSGMDWRRLKTEPHEATPYASVHKYSHDVAPARAALGAGGCTDCHHRDASFLRGPVLMEPFSGDDAEPRWAANYEILAMPFWSVRMGEIREQTLKPALYLLLGLNALLLAVLVVVRVLLRREMVRQTGVRRWLVLVVLVAAGVQVLRTPGLMDYMVIDRFALDARHFWVSLAAMGLGAAVAMEAHARSGSGPTRMLARMLLVFLGVSAASGGVMLLGVDAFGAVGRLAYTLLDAGLVAVLGLATLGLLGALVERRDRVAGAPGSPTESTVKERAPSGLHGAQL